MEPGGPGGSSAEGAAAICTVNALVRVCGTPRPAPRTEGRIGTVRRREPGLRGGAAPGRIAGSRVTLPGHLRTGGHRLPPSRADPDPPPAHRPSGVSRRSLRPGASLEAELVRQGSGFFREKRCSD